MKQRLHISTTRLQMPCPLACPLDAGGCWFAGQRSLRTASADFAGSGIGVLQVLPMLKALLSPSRCRLKLLDRAIWARWLEEYHLKEVISRKDATWSFLFYSNASHAI